MTSRSPSRWLAPLALLASVLAVMLIVGATTGDEGGGGGAGGAEPTIEERQEAAGETGTGGEETSTGSRTSTAERRTYRVRPGDTLALISERTGLSVEELQELNPEIDPNNLSVGERLRLTE